jgi:DNA polymerase-3 subunit gamma/tau
MDAAIARGVDLSHLARAVLMTLRDAAVIQSVPDPDGLVDLPAEEIDAIRKLVAPVPRPHLLGFFDRFAKACEELSKSPAPRLILEVALIDMASAEPLVPIAELVDRLHTLESRVRSGPPAPKPSPRPASASASVPAPAPNPTPNPTPPPPPAPTPTPTPPPPPVRDFRALIDRIRSMTVRSYLEQARLLSWDDKAMELGYTSTGMATQNADEIKKAVQEALQSQIDVRVKIVKADTPAAAPSLVEDNRARDREQREKREEEARTHPINKATLEIFGASIKEIKVDG